MAETVVQRLLRLLPFFDKDDDKFRSLVANPDGVALPTINSPDDYQQGAMANLLEYLTQMSQSLLRMLRPDLQDSFWLNYTGSALLGVSRFEGETDADYLMRIRDTIFGIKCTCPAIVNALMEYSSPLPPSCNVGESIGAFADVTFADVFTQFQNQTPGPEFNYWTWPAIAVSGEAVSFFFVIIIYNTAPADVPKAADIIRELAAAGINWNLQVQSI